MATILNPTYRSRLGYQAALLGGMCYLMSMLLIGGNTATHQLIDQHVLNDKLALLDQVMPHSLYDNDPVADSQVIQYSDLFKEPIEILPARLGNEFSGAALNLTVQGWGGPLNFIMAVDASGQVLGVRVINHKETPGLADKIELDKDDWITGFDGRSLSNTSHIQWAVKKDNGDFDQFTGATITPRALVSGVYRGLQCFQQWRQQAQAQTRAKEESGS
ncbi:MAG: RnfABCDGE type electron transport complex subunit G [Pseudomonadota bacterium]|nr:RnfABCDGE type electron transport complex subunit G [Pseudomonadota bacterium]